MLGNRVLRLRLPITVAGAALTALLPRAAFAAVQPVSVSPLDCAGPNSCRIVSVYQFVFWMAMFVLVVVGGLILFAAIRFRRRDESEPSQVHGNTRLEIAWTLVPLVMLLFIFGLTFSSMDFVRNGPHEDMTVRVTAQQFAFQFIYPNGARRADLTIPTGKVVRLEVTSKDVLHAFWVPRLGGQIYAIPGQMNHGWIEATNPGTYLGQCNELCGRGHAFMQISVTAMSPAQYDSWYAALK
ncbi:MAG TPA: cytochrome c oxidase subunit II [Candidatus Limnocylindrales bacterium]|nr:cytochrome c oxidase subunit II [Candidatus Limnocylindrales bacterium]